MGTGTGLDWTGLDWTGLHWTGLGLGLDWDWDWDWTGLHWTTLDCTGLAGWLADSMLHMCHVLKLLQHYARVE